MTESSRPPVDVHDPALCAPGIAREIDDLVRALNYTTRPGDPRLECAADVYSVLGALREALAKLPQACGQLAAFLQHHEATGALRASAGFPHPGRPGDAVTGARFHLREAAVAANVTAAALGDAQTATSGLSHLDPPPAPASARPGRSRPATPARPGHSPIVPQL